MRIELTSPCCLHLGLIRADDGALCELGLTLQHPPIQLSARPASHLSIVGPRADLAAAEAARLNLTGEIEIELAIPANMGLSSDGMLAAAMKRLKAVWQGAPLSFRMTLPERACHEGGLLLTNDDGLVQARAEMAHAAEEDDWVVVLVLPKEPDDSPETFEADQRLRLIAAAHHLPDLRADVAALFDAARRDDFDAFTQSLSQVHAANEAALAVSSHPITLTDQDRAILEFMRGHGAACAARTLTGLGLYGWVKGGPASRALRKALTQHLGYFGPLVMASICDNQGARVNVS